MKQDCGDVATRLYARSAQFTAAERRVADALLARYPSAALETVAALARRAGVSEPTVLRLVAKLGFEGFPAFQAAILREVDARLTSPATAFAAQPVSVDDPHAAALGMMAAMLQRAAAETMPAAFDAMVALATGPRRLLIIGGRYSTLLAQRLTWHLEQMREGVALVPLTAGRIFDPLAGVDRQTAVIAFDFRRYQPEILAFCRAAKARGAAIGLFTDPWRSPIAGLAEAVLAGPVESPSPFDSKIVALAQTEALAGAVARQRPVETRRRLAAIEAARHDGEAALREAESP